jgi:hypothetical protein
MKPLSFFSLALAGILFGGTLHAEGFNNEAGLAGMVSNFHTETFDGVSVPIFTPVGNLFNDVHFGSDSYVVNGINFGPHMDGNSINTLEYTGDDVPVSILRFNAPMRAAAFAFITPFATESVFTALYHGHVVESFTAATNSGDTPVNFYGFRGITFDTITVYNGPYNEAVIDNLQMSAIPEPASLGLLLSGLSLLAWRGRRKRVV